MPKKTKKRITPLLLAIKTLTICHFEETAFYEFNFYT